MPFAGANRDGPITAPRDGEIPFKKRYRRMFIDHIDVGRNGARIRVKRGAVRRQIDQVGADRKVPISMGEWRALRDETANTYIIEINM